MLEQALHLREECDELYDFLKTLKESDWNRPTPFKNWTVNNVVDHLHGTDKVAVLSLKDHDAFNALKSGSSPAIPKTSVEGTELLGQWRDYYIEMCDLLGAADPKLRLPWFGPDMSVRMMATARQMETWAHGQDAYDLFKTKRRNTDRIKNIALIGVRTYGWTFVNRGLKVPADTPYVRLTAPSGAVWEWNQPNDHNLVQGSAVEFCHVVTQGRNVLDCNLTVLGETANKWMSIAQCFAGRPEDPPKPGERTS